MHDCVNCYHPCLFQMNFGEGGGAHGDLKSKCYQCLGNHNPTTCKFKTSECYKKMGHMTRACHEGQGSESARMIHLRDSGGGPAGEDNDKYLLFRQRSGFKPRREECRNCNNYSMTS